MTRVQQSETWQQDRQQQAEAVYAFICQYLEIHHKPPSLSQCADGTRLNEYRVRQAIARLRRQNRLSQSSLRPMQKAVQARNAKRGGDATD